MVARKLNPREVEGLLHSVEGKEIEDLVGEVILWGGARQGKQSLMRPPCLKESVFYDFEHGIDGIELSPMESQQCYETMFAIQGVYLTKNDKK